jgi:hypothetical protein
VAEGEDGVEGVGVGEDHEEAVDAEGDAAGGGHVGEGGEEGFVEGVGLGAASFWRGVGLLEAGALFGGVGEFGVGVGDFDAAEVELPAFGAGGVLRFAAGEGGEGGGVVDEDHGAVGGEGGFDAGDEVEVEAVGVEFRAGSQPACWMKAWETVFFPQVLGEGEGLALPGEVGGAAELGGEEGEQRLGIGEDFEVAGVGAVPFEEGELGMVPAAMFAGAEAGAELEDRVARRRRGGVSWPARGRCAGAAAGGNGVDVGLRRVGRKEHRGVDLEKAALAEEAADGVGELGAQSSTRRRIAGRRNRQAGRARGSGRGSGFGVQEKPNSREGLSPA